VRLDPNLSEFNRRFAWAVRARFSDRITAEQCSDGRLCLRGPKPPDQRVCELVAVQLDRDVLAALDFATPLQRDAMIRRLIDCLSAQLRARCDGAPPGETPVSILGTLEMLTEG
jgi:hypothetical protein